MEDIEEKTKKKTTNKEAFFDLIDNFAVCCGEMLEAAVIDKRFELAYQVALLRHRIAYSTTLKKIGETYCCDNCGGTIIAVEADKYDFCPYCGLAISETSEEEEKEESATEETIKEYTEPKEEK